MEIMDAVRCDENRQREAAAMPADARIIFEILAGEESPATNRRRFPRFPYQVQASMEVHDDPIPIARTIYTRDANQWGAGFVTQEVAPVGKDAMLNLQVAGKTLRLRCCILRCREVLPGWYEGAALLYVEEPLLAKPRMR